jgi:hypothetical protein
MRKQELKVQIWKIDDDYKFVNWQHLGSYMLIFEIITINEKRAKYTNLVLLL